MFDPELTFVFLWPAQPEQEVADLAWHLRTEEERRAHVSDLFVGMVPAASYEFRWNVEFWRGHDLRIGKRRGLAQSWQEALIVGRSFTARDVND